MNVLLWEMLILTILPTTAVWFNRSYFKIPFWCLVLCSCTTIATLMGLMKWQGLLAIIIPLVLSTLINLKPTNTIIVKSFKVLLVGYCLILGLNILPFFERITFVAPELVGNGTIPVGLQFSLAKPLSGILLLGLLAPTISTYFDFKEYCKAQKFIIGVAGPTLIVLCIAFALGLRFDVKFVSWWYLFVISNLVFTVVAEEAFFRGAIHYPLLQKFGQKVWVPVIVAIIFAGLHYSPVGVFNGKALLMVFFAGVVYGYSFQKYGKIEFSILTHWLVNSLHFVFFTYPFSTT